MSICCYILDHENSRKYTQELTSSISPYPYIVYDSSKHRTSFTSSFNRSLMAFMLLNKSNWVMVCNNDIDLDYDRLVELENILERSPQGIYSPLVSSFFDFMFTKKNENLFSSTPWLEFVCPIIHKDVIRSIGLLDEKLTLGYGIDIDYCYRARNLGYGINLIQNVFVRHFGHKSQENRQEYNNTAVQEMEKVLLNKYGADWKSKLFWAY